MEELHRVMKPGAVAHMITPYWTSVGAIQDPTHQWPPIAEAAYYYFNKAWRERGGLQHYGIDCDFDFEFTYCLAPELQQRPEQENSPRGITRMRSARSLLSCVGASAVRCSPHLRAALPWQAGLMLMAYLLSATAHAKHLYQYTDATGVVHFTDLKPGEDIKDVKASAVRMDPEPLVRTREEGPDAFRTLVFVNTSGGPVTVELSMEKARGVRTEPALPARIVLPGRTDTRALRIIAINPENGYSYRYIYRYMPGDVHAKPDPAARYQLPFAPQQRFGISQAFGGKASHSDAQNYYAVDIAMPEGTPVLAARDGVVMTVDNDFFGAGLDMKKYGDRANNVRIVHADGTMAVYAHLQVESARVHVGDKVRAGQPLALSGDTGYTNGPHLHFCVQRNENMELRSVPFQFSAPQGAFTPQAGTFVGGY